MKKKRARAPKPTADQLDARVKQFVAALCRESSAGSALRLLTEAVARTQRVVDSGGEPVGEFFNEFQSAFTSGGSIVGECDFCGRTYFASWTDNDYEDGELEELRKLAADPKNKYVEWGDVDSISRGELDGRMFVHSCDCNAAAAYESFIWNHRYSIAEYFKIRARDEASRASVSARISDDVSVVNTI